MYNAYLSYIWKEGVSMVEFHMNLEASLMATSSHLITNTTITNLQKNINMRLLTKSSEE